MMSSTQVWLTIVCLVPITILTRAFFLLFGTRVSLSPAVQRALRYAPVGALVAIIAPEVLLSRNASGVYEWTWMNPQLWGGIAATIVFVTSRSMLATIAVGIVCCSAAKWYAALP